MTTATGRTGMVSKGNTLAHYASQLDYTEGALRMEGERLTWDEVVALLERGGRLTGDCEAFFTEDCKWNGCSDPNRLGYNGYGYTGTILNSMPHIALADALEGDAIVFGAWPGLHCVWITESHPTNPKVNNPPYDPTIDGHGEPGFTQDTLSELWDSVFPGQPITVLSLAPFLPKVPPPPADPHGYLRFDPTVLKSMPHPNVGGKTGATNTEEKVVKAYDVARLHPKDNAAELAWLEVDLEFLVKRVQNNEKNDPSHSISEDRPWRLTQLKEREAGDQVVK